MARAPGGSTVGAGQLHRGDLRAMSSVPALLFVVAAALLFVVSGGILWLVGLNYEGLTGSPLSKIHPGTYLVVLLVVWAACEAGNPVGVVVAIARQRPACLLLLAATAILFLEIVTRAGPGMAGTLDTFMLPPFVVVLFAMSDEPTRRRLEGVIHLSMLANGLLGLVEFATKHLFFPYRFDGAVFPFDTRSTALQGHPLGNATITAVYILALMGGGGSLSMNRRVAMISLQMAAMVAFGGRVALVTVVVLGGIGCLVMAHRALRSGPVPILGVAGAILALTFGPVIVTGLYVGGFFDALLDRFAADGGSANARVEMINLLGAIPLRDLLVGPDTGLVDSLRRINGLELGIENPIVRMILYQGAAVTALVMLAVGLFLYEIMRWSRPGMLMAMLGCLIIINTFESIASKTTILAKFALMMLVLFRIRRGTYGGGIVRPSARMMSGSSARLASSITPIPSNRFQNAQANPRDSAASRTSRT